MSSPDATNLLMTQLTAGAACAYVVQLLQKWSKAPWITEHTTGINTVLKLILAGVSTLGISWVWSSGDNGSHVIAITIPSATTLLYTLWHMFGQYALQHGWGKIFSLEGTTPPVKPAV